MTPHLAKYFERWRKIIDRSLEKFLRQEKGFTRTISKAMRYSVFAGGKRLRPILAVAGAEICGLDGRKVLPAACAMELIHTYSLVHDDLPAMDDDDLRRGRPTSHKVFGEGNAILAGDALLTYAFELASKNGKMLGLNPALFGDLIQVIAEGAGYKGMIGGQAVDLEMDGGHWLKSPVKKRKEILHWIHKSKTAALIRSSILAGAVLAKAGPAGIKKLGDYGTKIGLAFQIADDILDITGDKKLLGKKGSDAKNRKLTYPAIYGIEASKQKAETLASEAKKCLKSFGNRSKILTELADYTVRRTY